MSSSPRASAGTVLIVDDEQPVVAVLVRLLSREGFSVHTASDGESALTSIEAKPPDVCLLDVRLPGIDGFEVCRRIKQNSRTRLTPVVMVTGLDAREHRIAGIHAGADDFLCKPVDPEELRARVGSLVRLKRYTDELDHAESVILSLALTVEARDACTQGHCDRLAQYAQELGRRLGLGAEERRALRLGGYLHDVGKIAIPDAVLLKAGRLTAGEYETIKQHTVIGERLCGSLRSLVLVRPIVRHHHERLDGTGYPDGLHGDRIPMLAQIVSVADVYDALTTDRPYRGALADADAFQILREEAQRGWWNVRLVEELIAARCGGEPS
ncbi:MAG: response regulator [Luteitalea sp.]|nr:response regulator [Luteitalea sp.]